MTLDVNSTLSTPNDAVFVTINLQVDPAKLDEFIAIMWDAAPDTRAWDGCQMFDIYVNQDIPGHVVFYEMWSSKEQQGSYLQWRGETGFLEMLGLFLTAELDLAYLSKVG
ncbi:MAG: antibiotic biosynthesis monooxygenase [Proteobacteria bacterium]|nr:antibiotic biosynthesis monooxygenase [Pseudomonadota bacterium]